VKLSCKCLRGSSVSDAREFAKQAHRDQMYGDKKYIYHLDQVYEILLRFNKDPHLLMGAYLHDVIEDTVITVDEVSDKFGSRVASLVWAVSDGLGNSRRERKAVAYKKIQSIGDDAIAIKLADRIANVSNSRMHNARIYSMYKREQSGFKSALFLNESRTEVIKMWNHLDTLFS
jgi:(p)ppGpp synthase/HD superfamily hydrolase